MALSICVLWIGAGIALTSCGDDDESTRPDPDTTPPAAVTDLAIAAVAATSVTLRWSAPGEDGAKGTASAYDIRWSTTAINASNWSAATQAASPPSPKAAGSIETHRVEGLAPGTSYHFALKSVDDRGNWSLLSNVASDTTAASGPSQDDFILVQPGAFAMGSPADEPGRDSDEIQHQVALTEAFYVSKHEVTQSEWESVMGWNESYFQGANRPAERFSWYDAVQYCNQRSARDGYTPVYTVTSPVYSGNHITSATVTWNQSANGYRLLTEAEWEYACRATSQTAFCNGGIADLGCGNEPNLAAVGWYCGNSGGETHDVGGKAASLWGLEDMHGNVWEWCWDWYAAYAGDATDPVGPTSGSNRVARGGGCGSLAPLCRSANRSGSAPGLSGASDLGLRLSRTAGRTATPVPADEAGRAN